MSLHNHKILQIIKKNGVKFNLVFLEDFDLKKTYTHL